MGEHMAGLTTDEVEARLGEYLADLREEGFAG